MSCCFFWRADPGPCPVDDTPHTACTPETSSLTVPLETPGALERLRRRNPPSRRVEISTKTYSRKTVRKALRGD